MPPTRHFFRKAIAPPPKPPCESRKRKYHRNQIVVAESIHPITGNRVVRRMTAGAAARRIAASKAGKASQASGRANRFTSESGSKASKKLWKTRQRMVKGIRIGVKLSGRKTRLDRVALRKRFNGAPHLNITYLYEGQALTPGWYRQDPTTLEVTCITERTALYHLGYLKKRMRFVPTKVTVLPLAGRFRAVGTDNSTSSPNPIPSGDSQ